MTRKHFRDAVTVVLLINNHDSRHAATLAFCRFFAMCNPRFDKERFMAACGF